MRTLELLVRPFCISDIYQEGKSLAEDEMIDCDRSDVNRGFRQTRLLSLPVDAAACNGATGQSVVDSESDVLALYETCDVSSTSTWRVTH